MSEKDHDINRRVLAAITDRWATGKQTTTAEDLLKLSLPRSKVMQALTDFENAGDIYKLNGGFAPLMGDETYRADSRGANFKVGDILLHKLTRERLLVLRIDDAHADEPLYEVRTNGYRAVVLREQELLPYVEEDERAPLPGEPRVPIHAERVEIVTPNAVTLVQEGGGDVS